MRKQIHTCTYTHTHKHSRTHTHTQWRKSGTETVAGGEAVCPECKGTGRIAGGLSTLPGFDWWPIKAFRPCPTCEKEGREYQRRGQGLNEVIFAV